MQNTSFYKVILNSSNLYGVCVEGHCDYYPFGSPMQTRSWSSGAYRFGFNGKEKDDEIKGDGNFCDYGMRNYDTRIGRPFCVDMLASKYPELSPFQFFTNNPILNIDLDGLEGLQYLEITKLKDGTTLTKRVVEIDIYVATSEKKKSTHYKSAEIPLLKQDYLAEFNKGFLDIDKNTVEFRFNMKTFDADITKPKIFAKNLRADKNNYVWSKGNVTLIQKGCVLLKDRSLKDQGKTFRNYMRINVQAREPSHTRAHELCHMFLNINPDVNPTTDEQHDDAGGIFKLRVRHEDGTIKEPTQPLSQKNVDLLLKNIPEIENKIIDEK